MKTIAHRELRNHSAEVLRAVQGGESYEVTNNGELVAILSPANSSPLHGVRYRPMLQSGKFSDLPRVSTAMSTEEALEDLRAER
jgi:prevent-host-death family protein